MTGWADRVGQRLDSVRAAGRWRSIRTLDGVGPRFELDGRPVVSYASNDYLGLSSHPAVLAAAQDAAHRWGTGAGASRLVVGARPVHADLEAELAAWKQTAAALLFPTGYAANVGVLTALADAPEVLVVSDELNHASIIDGARLARGRVEIARHADVEHVESLLAAHTGPALVVVDSVFSMDGDEAPVAELAEVCARHGALLVLDEAHAVLGPALPAAAAGDAVVRVGTLSKTLGSLGGFVAGPSWVVDLLVNTARPFIFSTAPTPADTAAALAALRVVRSAAGDELIARLRSHVAMVRPGHPSPIIPVVLGDEDVAMKASQALLEQGLLVPAIRPPTVPAGTSRLPRRPLGRPHRRRHRPPRHRPRRPVIVVHCVGTATDVGKTYVGAAALTELRRRGLSVAARKPVQSFDPTDRGPKDADVLAAATGEHPDDVCPPGRSFGVAMAPPMAADVLGRDCPTIDELVVGMKWPDARPEIAWVEGVGGPRSPIASDGDGVDFCRELAPDVVVIVADAGLGTINAVVLSAGPYAALGHDPIVVLNRYDDGDDLHRRNRAWLADRWGFTVTTDAVRTADVIVERR